MPELPEVETVRRGLAALLPGLRVENVTFDWAKSFPNAPEDVQQFLVGAHITEVKRRAKVLIIELDSKYSLVIHLKMTGQLVFRAHDDTVRFGAGHPNRSLVGELPDKSTRVIFEFSKNVKGPSSHMDKLFFNDQRKFGWVRLLPTAEVPNIDFFQKVGPEPLAAEFTPKDFRERLLRRPNSIIKAVLLDQTVIAGVGNIYADESLWGAKIHPATRVKDVPTAQLTKLYHSLRDVMELSITKGGSSDRNYVDAHGMRGSYLSFANVFRRNGQPCPRCGTIIIKTKVAGRGTHICPKCQK
jgi:formamidopyrimidine-DNA glycosylase